MNLHQAAWEEGLGDTWSQEIQDWAKGAVEVQPQLGLTSQRYPEYMDPEYQRLDSLSLIETKSRSRVGNL